MVAALLAGVVALSPQPSAADHLGGTPAPVRVLPICQPIPEQTGACPTKSDFSPGDRVTREQMAAFLARIWRALGNECPAEPGPVTPFADVPDSSFAKDDIRSGGWESPTARRGRPTRRRTSSHANRWRRFSLG